MIYKVLEQTAVIDPRLLLSFRQILWIFQNLENFLDLQHASTFAACWSKDVAKSMEIHIYS
jgi:hypothetical protein